MINFIKEYLKDTRKGHKNMTFAVDIRQWKTVEEFAAHLKAHNPDVAPWATGAIVHHTYRPLQSQWRGQTTMNGLKNFYIDKGWDAGPHLFIAANSPNPADDGIWQLTPLNMVGIHAGVCNSHYWGIEVVGDYDNVGWSPETQKLTIGAIGELIKWRSLSVTPASVKGHRDCNSPKTCPGKAIDMNNVRQLINNYVANVPEQIIVTKESTLLSLPRCTIEQASKYILNRAPTPVYTNGDITLSILPGYWNICERVGIDPCITIAQIVHETGNLSSWWCQRPRRNPAGIGVTGESRTDQPSPEDINKWAWNDQSKRWQKGVSFTNWGESAIAHVGRLVAYATKPAERTDAQKQLVTQALSYRTLPQHMHGVAPTLQGLGGTWAYPGTAYAAKLAEIANAIIAVK